MEDKLNLLLTQINLENKEYFKGGKLTKIICNKTIPKFSKLSKPKSKN